MRALASRRVVGIAVAITAGTGIGWGAYTIGNAAGADTTVFPRAASSTTTGTTDSPGTTETSPGTPSTPEAGSTGAPAEPLNLDQAVAVAVDAAPPGRIGTVTEDHEPTGLRYDVTILHDNGTSTDVEVDTVTGQVTDLDHDDDWD
jgi:Peptidase propeptide and YPEB domain